MRYFLFIFLFIFTHFLYADENPSPSCLGSPSTCRTSGELQLQSQMCHSNGSQFKWITSSGAGCPAPKVIRGSCLTQCKCPQGYRLNTIIDSSGVYSTSCVPDEPAAEDDPNHCDESEKVYDPVSGSMVCPASGDSSSSPSSSSCIVPGDFNGDCVPDNEQGSSAAASVPSPPPTSGSNTSSPSTGGGGGDSNTPPSGGGGGGDSGGGSGGASASSASSGSNSSLSGDCDPRSKTYFSCITSQKLTAEQGGGEGWVPVSGYGNWLPVSEDSPCPNKFKDATGSWWCSGAASGASGGATGSSGSAGATSSASGKCDPTSENYLACISKPTSAASASSGSTSSVASSSNSSRSGAFSSLGEKGKFDGEASEKKLEDLEKELKDKIADIKDDINAQVGGTISGSGSLQDFCKNIRGNEVCFGMKKFEPYLAPIAAAIFLVACFISFSIVLRG